jgi:hypothetical protein
VKAVDDIIGLGGNLVFDLEELLAFGSCRALFGS